MKSNMGLSRGPTLRAATRGMVRPGNINLYDRPSVPNPRGGHSTVFSMSFEDPRSGLETLVPQVLANPPRLVGENAAAQHFFRTGQNLGMFNSPAAANKYANWLHLQQAALGVRRSQLQKLLVALGAFNPR